MALTVYTLFALVLDVTRIWCKWVYLTVVRPEPSQDKVSKLTDLKMLYKSDNFIVVNKHEDVKINSDLSSDHTVATQLEFVYPDTVDKTVKHGYRFIHRLDYATSGAICIALTKKAAQWGNKTFQNRNVTKHYLALVRGYMDPLKNQQREINIGIGSDTSVTDVHRMCIETTDHCGSPRNASTTLHLLQHGTYDGQPASKVLLVPNTGRTHQLRVHCLHIGHLIVGDYTYSGRQDVKPYRMMLHAYRLRLPMTREPIDVTAPDPFTPGKDLLWAPTQTFLTYEEFTYRTEAGL